MERSYYNKNKLPSDRRNKELRQKRKKISYRKALTVHHIVPLSKGGSNRLINKSKVVRDHHDKYHELFGNMTPHEILAWLEIYFWKNQKHWVDDYSFNRDEILAKNIK